MSLSSSSSIINQAEVDEPVVRELKHRRRVISDGYLRSDELWEVEAQMQDIKAYDVWRDFDGELVAQDTPFHDISVRIALDDTFVIKEIDVCIDAHPFPNCHEIAPNFNSLVGTSITSGWLSHVKKEFKGVAGCTHVLELMPVVATTAFQMMWYPLSDKYPERAKLAINSFSDNCHGWAEKGPMMTKIRQGEVG